MTSLQNAVVPIRYIGKKARKHDTVHHTGTVWEPGQTLPYPAGLAKGLLLHSDVWRLGKREDIKNVEEEEVMAAASAPAGGSSDSEAPGNGTALHPEDRVTQSELTKDRTRGPGGARATLE